MNELVKVFQFEDKPLTVVMYKGRAAFIAKEVGERLGYTKKLSDLLRDDWGCELVEGDDYVVLRGSELNDFREMLGVSTESVPAKARNMALLFETGIHAIALLSRKPEARRLRKFLSSEVMPQLVRDGRFLPDRKVTEAGELVGRETGLATLSVKERVMLMAEDRKQYEAETKRMAENRKMIEVEAKKLRCEVMEKNAIARLAQDDFKRREQKSKAIMEAAEARLAMGQIDSTGYNAHKLKASEIITGERIGTWATGDSGERFITPTELAKKLKTTPHHIGELVSEVSRRLGIDVRNDRRYTRPRLHRIPVKSSGDDLHADGYSIGELLEKEVIDIRREEFRKVGKQLELCDEFN